MFALILFVFSLVLTLLLSHNKNENKVRVASVIQWLLTNKTNCDIEDEIV